MKKKVLVCKFSSFCLSFREASHLDFVHEKRHMDVGGGGG